MQCIILYHSILFYIIIFVIPFLLIGLCLSFGPLVLEWFAYISVWCIFIQIVILLPLYLFKRSRFITAIGCLIFSYIYGICLVIYIFHHAFEYRFFNKTKDGELEILYETGVHRHSRQLSDDSLHPKSFFRKINKYMCLKPKL